MYKVSAKNEIHFNIYIGLYTIFAPTNEAIEHEKKYPGETTLDEKISFHIARGQFKAKDIKNEVTVKTLLSHRTIRFNKYSNGKVRWHMSKSKN